MKENIFFLVLMNIPKSLKNKVISVKKRKGAGQQTTALRPNPQGYLRVYINKVLWNTAINLHIFYNCFHTVTAEFSNCNRDCMTVNSK